MPFQILDQYKQKYPEHANLLNEFDTYYNRKYPISHSDCGMNCQREY